MKPLAYVRYGDDFVLFSRDEQTVTQVQEQASSWLLQELKLPIHNKNNVIFLAKHGLFFLGHRIYPNSPLSVDKAMRRKAKTSISARNVASYIAMHLPKKDKRQLPWLLNKYEE